MARPLIDLSAVLRGDRETERMFRELDQKLQTRVFRSAARKSANRILNRILLNMSNDIIDEITGRTIAAFERLKPVNMPRKPGYLGVGLKWPTRAALGIGADDKHYFPFALEYGHGTVAPRPFWRAGVAMMRDSELGRIRNDIVAALQRIAKRAALNRAAA